MKKNNKYGLIVIITIAVIAIAGTAVYLLTRNNATSDAAQTTSQANVDSADYKKFAALKGENYDEAFIAGMIVHHQGAIDMAKLALTNAGRQEVKDLANDIVSAQTTEISNMQAWQKAWGYSASSADSTSMMDSNAQMMDSLTGKTGEAFDKAFVEQMIMHHQSAINMAAPGKSNAQHQELKDLTVEIVDAQTKEIQKMKQWQQDWGYTPTDAGNSMPGMSH